MRSRTVRHTFKSPSESTLWVAQMNERNFCYAAAARLYREAGDELSAKRCEASLASDLAREEARKAKETQDVSKS